MKLRLSTHPEGKLYGTACQRQSQGAIIADMKKATVIILLALMSMLALNAAGDERALPPVYSYLSLQSGYNATVSDADGFQQAVPLSFQSGVLSNSDDGSYALGFGTRVDIDFGVGSDASLFSMDVLLGADVLLRLNDHVSFGLLAGLDVAVVDSESHNDGIVTMGPGAVFLTRLSPMRSGALAFDIGLAAYGHFALGEDYAGASLVPFVGITFDFSSFPYLFYPYHVSHVIVF